MKKTKVKSKKVNYKRVIKNIMMLLFWCMFLYVVVDRVQDIKGIEFFFTTWSN